jgi:hypothetical protein
LASQRLKKASEVLKFWLDKLKKIKEMEMMMKRNSQLYPRETEDKEIQVEMDSNVLSPIKDVSPISKKPSKKRDSTKGANTSLKNTGVALKRMVTKNIGQKKLKIERKPTIVKGGFGSHVTTAKPFQFNSKLRNKLPKQVKI